MQYSFFFFFFFSSRRRHTRSLRDWSSDVCSSDLHILGAEWIYLERWQGRSPEALLDAATFPDVQSLESRWETVKHDQADFIQALTPQRLVEELGYVNLRGQRYSYPLWQQMVHVVNHSSYHRGQITTLLRQLGAEAASTDFLVYYDEKPKQISIAP